jgi:hypothetical protein
MDTPEGTQRVYFDQKRMLTPDQIDVGYAWEIQLAFRWVLQPDRPEDIYRYTDPDVGD